MSDLSPVSEAIARELARRPRPNSFSERAFQALLATQDEYVEDLSIEAIRIARREESDSVSEAQVHHARAMLQSRSKRVAWLELLGGVLAGGGFAQTLTNFVASNNPEPLSWVVSSLILGAGLLMLGASIARR
ncbi:hypothetical protein [Aeromicrobium terrae]|uniref:DUF2335 domain-containing protein n=1 Tax=Aeromicrobium terrae TaxID=2498846 RepID=A0A5C8NIB2_9ACTN|nr:hypothetical protein [Aeromicrobium terrae]TXL60846.1 hypothetical protein FHP06_10510 [Aeromicrobium terrae]